jgi:hypothetical protein
MEMTYAQTKTLAARVWRVIVWRPRRPLALVGHDFLERVTWVLDLLFFLSLIFLQISHLTTMTPSSSMLARARHYSFPFLPCFLFLFRG